MKIVVAAVVGMLVGAGVMYGRDAYLEHQAETELQSAFQNVDENTKTFMRCMGMDEALGDGTTAGPSVTLTTQPTESQRAMLDCVAEGYEHLTHEQKVKRLADCISIAQPQTTIEQEVESKVSREMPNSPPELREAWRQFLVADEYFQEDERKGIPPKIESTYPQPMGSLAQKLVDAGQRYLKASDPNTERRALAAFEVGRAYYHHKHFTEALPVLASVVERQPDHPVACGAASAILDIYNQQKNYKALLEAVTTYRRHPKMACSKDETSQWADIEQKLRDWMAKSTQ